MKAIKNWECEKNEALNAEQRKNELVVYLAHDIKTPLTSVIGYLSLLEETPDMEAAQKNEVYTYRFEKGIPLGKFD